jgi:putative ABC transport system permease protein
MEAIHSHGVLHESPHTKESDDEHHHEHAHHHESDHDTHSDHTEHNVITPKHITAFMLGLKVKATSLIVQRQINEFAEEPLTAVLPGVALAELWQVMKVLENTLRLVSVFIAMASLLGLSAVLMALLRERRDEMQLLRTIGAPSAFILLLVELEAVLLTLLGVVMGSVLLYLLLSISNNFLSQRFGLSIDPDVYHPTSLWLMVAMVLIAAILAFIPAWSAYRKAV